MKLVKSINDKTYVFKFTKKEFEVVQYLIVNDDSIDSKFDIVAHSDKLECIITQLSDIPFEYLINYLNHCFAKDLISKLK